MGGWLGWEDVVWCVHPYAAQLIFRQPELGGSGGSKKAAVHSSVGGGRKDASLAKPLLHVGGFENDGAISDCTSNMKGGTRGISS